MRSSPHQVYLNYQQYATIYYEYKRGLHERIADQSALLLSAKACFFKGDYKQCKKILKSVRLDESSKILYERQMLLLKVNFIQNPLNFRELQKIAADYENMKDKVPGFKLNQFHQFTIDQIMQFAFDYVNNALGLKMIDKEKVRQLIKTNETKIKFQGMPSFLVSTQWMKKLNQFLQGRGEHPGPISNFDILNHVFQLKPHNQPSKQGMDKIVFPVTENANYLSIDGRYWRALCSIFMGFPIKRSFSKNPLNGQVTGGDSLVKTVIHTNERQYIYQWQTGTFWQKSVLPVLHWTLNEGQLKIQTKNGDFQVVQPGIVYQPVSNLIYKNINGQRINAVTKEQKDNKLKILRSYDLQQYYFNDDSPKWTCGIQNIANFDYMNSILQMLAGLMDITQYFISNLYLKDINLDEGGSNGQVLCAYADVVKRLWFLGEESSNLMLKYKGTKKGILFIDPYLLKKAFFKKFIYYDTNQPQNSHTFLMDFLNCLHNDLVPPSSSLLQHSLTGFSIQNLYKDCLSLCSPTTIFSQKLKTLHYTETICSKCQNKQYIVKSTPTLEMQVIEDAPKITVFMIEVKDQKEAKKIQVYIGQMEILKQIIDEIIKYFLVKPQNLLFGFLYYEKVNDWQILADDIDLRYIVKQLQKGAVLFIHQVVPPQFDEEVALLSYFYKDKSIKEIVNDGFPRIVTIKKCFKHHEYYQELLQLVISTIPVNKFNMDKKRYFKKVKNLKVKKNVYTIQYQVYTAMKIKNYSNISLNRVLGKNREKLITLQSLFQNQSKKDRIDLNQKWLCYKCNQIQIASRTQNIFQLSKYLIIHLNRFKKPQKISTRVEYPVYDLNMRPFIPFEHINPSTTYMYNLYSVVLHRGTADLGHFYTFNKNVSSNIWYLHDDESTQRVQQNLIVDTNAYILVYIKKDEMSKSSIQ